MKFFSIFILFALPSANAFAEEFLKPGTPIPEIQWEDQFEEPISLAKDTKKIIYSNSKDGSKVFTTAFESKKQEYFIKHKALVLADIRKMPSIISKLIAIPKMRKYEYKIALIRSDEKAIPFPSEENQVSLIVVENGKLKSVAYTSDPQEVLNFVEK